ncbi:hypothetical protein TMatcc_002593 [Talaromyces marneffei ATCC 18224]|uniref:Lectin family integral membrane protein, putative n=2 Tax=Talaromyces marneffei TaxID=37727 RepID=B6Q2U5_TALMQ|nr:uncharacterized protein EYB26_002299 [Talaromyces marneffei]EEA29043.1 lectin family integral membrane protein, putative [Talaromyces marneffei ATCC 18224]KAE8555360.1 hypothetical protein EYB25_000055 [Talaromyces marneffei]QGA14643.1 hypothetical protein EYB26_002299 [Talaromyces marneffei]
MKYSIALAFLTTVSAQSILDTLSFGHGSRFSPNGDSLPGWRIKGEGHEPQILSDKLILTPPYPGHTRGSIWAENSLPLLEWTSEFHFRASGEERGSGNLQLWYVKDGERSVGASSIYTVGQFDGFVLTIDTHGGRGGSIRGFLNDGTIAYNQHSNVDSLAFGHCDYAYRNLGRPSVIKIEQSSSLFQVTVDDKVCFQTPKVILPAGNVFGVTAATPDNPDSFELFKFVVTPGAQVTAQFAEQTTQQQQQQVPIESRSQSNNINLGSLDNINGRIQKISQEVSQIAQNINERHQELLNKISAGSVASSSDSWPQNEARLNAMDERLRRIEAMLSDLQRDNAGKDYRNEFTRLHKAIENSHHSLTEALQTSIFNMITATTPRMGLFIFVVIAFQLLLAGVYVYYKRRRNGMPKKFL